MSIIDSVRNNKFYQQTLQDLSEQEREYVEEETEKLVSSLQALADNVHSLLLNEDGRKGMLESLDEMLSEEDTKKCQEKN